MADRPGFVPDLADLDPRRAAGLQDEAQQLQKQSVLQVGIDRVASSVVADPEIRAEIAHYTAAGLKTGALFLRGRLAVASTLALYGTDEMSPTDDPRTMAVDGTLGVLKGAAMKGTFTLVGASTLNPAGQAFVLGLGSRFSDNLFERSNYYRTGAFDLTDGVANTFATTFDKHNIGTDIVTFGLSYGLFRGVNSLSNNAIANSKLLSTTVLGGSYGLVSGANQEMTLQTQKGELDLGLIAKRALAMGAVDAIAAIPGGIQANRAAAAGGNRQVKPDAISQTPGQTKVVTEAPVLKTRLEIKPVVVSPPRLELTVEQLGKVRESAARNNLEVMGDRWSMELSKPEFAPDGTPKVMFNGRGTRDTAFEGTARLATEVNHAVTLDWNGTNVRVEPGMKLPEVQAAHRVAEQAPERLEMYRRINAENARRDLVELKAAEAQIEALRAEPARNPRELFESLHGESAKANGNFAVFSIPRLRHPAEILEFARMYTKFEPEVGLSNMEGAVGRSTAPGTAKVWKQVLEQVRSEGAKLPSPAEVPLFERIHAHDALMGAARRFGLMLNKTDASGITVEADAPVSIVEAGKAASQFATSLRLREVTLLFNRTRLTVKAGATDPEINAAWGNANR